MHIDRVTCPYCGTLDNPSKANAGDGSAVNPRNQHAEGGNAHYKTLYFQCCKRVALSYVRGNQVEEMWPAPKAMQSPRHVPDAVRADFEEAAACLANNLPRSCALMSRRCIEAACED